MWSTPDPEPVTGRFTGAWSISSELSCGKKKKVLGHLVMKVEAPLGLDQDTISSLGKLPNRSRSQQVAAW
jgi:hypothetical protein